MTPAEELPNTGVAMLIPTISISKKIAAQCTKKS
jgi:hypothetical protein